MSKMKQRRQIITSDPTTWAADPTTMMGDPTGQRRQTAASGYASDLIPTANIAASVSAQGETGGGATVTMPIASPPIESESNPLETPTSTKRYTTVTQCEQCGGEFTPRRPHGRFCSSYCRRLAWLGRNPERAAELAARDRQRLREHIIGCGGEWVDRGRNDGT